MSLDSHISCSKGIVRIRVKISSSHTKDQMDKAIDLFQKAGRKFKIIK